jgi:putative ubiquitin-RnfH superfamily antitoxin RatB of RatAB toxin-antitoxin module
MVESLIEIEVVYATVDRQCLLKLSVPVGSTARSVVLNSGLGLQFPELDLATCPLGIFAKAIAAPEAHVLQAGNRLEIYRPLLADPKEVRRLRAAKAALARAQDK